LLFSSCRQSDFDRIREKSQLGQVFIPHIARFGEGADIFGDSLTM
jgi:hypothetical protein